MSQTQSLRTRLADGPLLVVPGAANALTARIVEDMGFEAAYVTGAGIANSFLGTPDVGLLTMSELAAHVGAIRDATTIPLIVDADTGFGNAVGVTRTVRVLERAGADAIQLEDQDMPKKCGHFDDKRLLPPAEMVGKVHAAVDTRNDGTVIIARTDAVASEGLDAAIDRAAQYADAGADVTFIEAPDSTADLLSIPSRLPVPQVINLVDGGRTPMVSLDQLGEFRIALFANAALQGAAKGVQRVLSTLRDTGSLEGAKDDLVSWDERQRLVGKPQYDELEQAYAP